LQFLPFMSNRSEPYLVYTHCQHIFMFKHFVKVIFA